MQFFLLKCKLPRTGILCALVLATVMISEKEAAIANSLPRIWPCQFDSAAAWNNLANSYLINAGEDSNAIDTAIAYYHRAIALAPEAAGIKLNLAIAYLMKDDTTKADSLFRVGCEQAGSIEEVYRLLGMKYERFDQDRSATPSVTEQEVRDRVKKGAAPPAGDKNKKPPSSQQSKPDKGKERPKKPSGKKSIDPKEINRFLHWRS
jgi:tetratricopeptide (TPR) repeat protein